MISTHHTVDMDALPTPSAGNDEADWDEIAESSWESFPASDPPAWVGRGSPRQPHPIAADLASSTPSP